MATGCSQTVKQLLEDSRRAIAASNAQQALQCVVQALKLLHGDNAVLPTLRAAAEHYHAQQAAPINELAELLAQVSIAAEQDTAEQQQQQQLPGVQQQQEQQQAHWGHLSQPMPGQHHVQQQLAWGAPHQLDGQQLQQHHAPGVGRPILEEDGRGSFTEAAMSDGSSWQCPHCSGVVPMQRQQAHLAYWCPALQQNSS